jgi:uncharacterized protein YehS (DUF1456 family)
VTNNDVLKSIRYILNVRDNTLVEIAALADYKVTLDEIAAYMKGDQDPEYRECPDKMMAHFLNGLIIFKRGKDESRPPLPIQTHITNNVVLKKLRVAFELKDTDIAALIEKCGLRVSKAELGAFFRSPEHRNYRECGDQFLRNLLKALST